GLIQGGWRLHHQRDYVQAEGLYRRALQADPGQPVALYCFGRLAFDVRNFEVAADLLARAAAVDPAQALYHADLAQALQMLDRNGEAIAAYHRAIELEPNWAGV